MKGDSIIIRKDFSKTLCLGFVHSREMAVVQDTHSPFTLSWRGLGTSPSYYFTMSPKS